MENMRKYFEVFKAKVEEIYDVFSDNVALKAVYTFYRQDPSIMVEINQKVPLLYVIINYLKKKYSIISFLKLCLKVI